RSGYLLYGIEPGLDFADQAAAMGSLARAQVVACTAFACESTLAVADVILPMGLLPEIDATLTNLDGREQRAQAAGKPPGEARAGWRVLRALAGALGVEGFEFTDMAGLLAFVQSRAASGAAARDASVAGAVAPAAGNDGDGLELVSTVGIYRSDAVVRRSAALQAHPLNRGPRIALHPADASAAGLADGAMARVINGVGKATLQVEVDNRVAQGTAWVEGGH